MNTLHLKQIGFNYQKYPTLHTKNFEFKELLPIAEIAKLKSKRFREQFYSPLDLK